MYVNQYIFWLHKGITYTLIYYSCKQYSISVWVILVIAKGVNAELGQGIVSSLTNEDKFVVQLG